MPLMPAFRFRSKDSGVVGRLIAGYGELEFLLSICVGYVLASQHDRPPSITRAQHRTKYESMGIKWLFKIRGEKKRIDEASQLMRGLFTQVGMRSEFDETMNAMRACLKIRNLFAHCHWARSKKRGLSSSFSKKQPSPRIR